MVMLCLTPRVQAQFDLLASIGLHKYLVESYAFEIDFCRPTHNGGMKYGTLRQIFGGSEFKNLSSSLQTELLLLLHGYQPSSRGIFTPRSF